MFSKRVLLTQQKKVHAHLWGGEKQALVKEEPENKETGKKEEEQKGTQKGLRREKHKPDMQRGEDKDTIDRRQQNTRVIKKSRVF